MVNIELRTFIFFNSSRRMLIAVNCKRWQCCIAVEHWSILHIQKLKLTVVIVLTNIRQNHCVLTHMEQYLLYIWFCCRRNTWSSGCFSSKCPYQHHHPPLLALLPARWLLFADQTNLGQDSVGPLKRNSAAELPYISLRCVQTVKKAFFFFFALLDLKQALEQEGASQQQCGPRGGRGQPRELQLKWKLAQTPCERKLFFTERFWNRILGYSSFSHFSLSSCYSCCCPPTPTLLSGSCTSSSQ